MQKSDGFRLSAFTFCALSKRHCSCGAVVGKSYLELRTLSRAGVPSSKSRWPNLHGTSNERQAMRSEKHPFPALRVVVLSVGWSGAPLVKRTLSVCLPNVDADNGQVASQPARLEKRGTRIHPIYPLRHSFSSLVARVEKSN